MNIEAEGRFQSRTPNGSMTRSKHFNVRETIDADTSPEPLKQNLNPFSIRSKDSNALDGYFENNAKDAPF